MNNKFKQLSLFSIALFILLGCKEPQKAEIGQTAPAIAVFDAQNHALTLPNSPKVLLSFWSGTCGACVAELKTLQLWAAKNPGVLQVLAINTDSQADLAQLTKKYQLELPMAKDQMQITGERYQISGTPTSILIEQGIVREKFEGLISEADLARLFSSSMN